MDYDVVTSVTLYISPDKEFQSRQIICIIKCFCQEMFNKSVGGFGYGETVGNCI